MNLKAYYFFFFEIEAVSEQGSHRSCLLILGRIAAAFLICSINRCLSGIFPFKTCWGEKPNKTPLGLELYLGTAILRVSIISSMVFILKTAEDIKVIH
ncbi:hypothetical protein LIL_10513 [Leptospira interrogans serovar Linhai str. 56609]|nr:hypothetical protein LIL_10513 [Leptospira interrogans serovar Linhai str. 56609]MCR8649849.1 hypothetical protein [Leptospira interrogans serovar Bataviae]